MNQTPPSPRRPRLLLLAYACSPYEGSEPGVGWNRALQAATIGDTWVICEEKRYGPPIRRYLDSNGPIPGLHFEFLPRTPLQRWIGKVPGLSYLSYNRWHWSAYQLARRLHEQNPFDLVHQVTFCGYREPGYLWRLGVPFVWGPVGGTQNYPWRFLSEAPLSGAVREALRSVVNRFQLRYSPRVHDAARHAAALLVANTTIQRDFQHVHSVPARLLLETGLRQVADAPPAPRDDGCFRMLWSGELQPWKALSLLLQALSRIPRDIRWEVTLLGKGPYQSYYQRMARRLGITDRIRWLGWLPHAEALARYRASDVLVFTSLRDTSGNVVLEAMAAGLPVICMDHQGMHDIVTSECGVKIPVTTPREVIPDLTAALHDLALDPARRHRMAWAALERAREFLWDRNGEVMAGIYQEVLDLAPVGCES